MTSSKMTARMNRWYDERMYRQQGQEYYAFSDYFNYGYWDEKTVDQKAACENLVEQLLACLPAREGNLLDVACGKGATTSYLLKYYEPEAITAINISEKQLTTARKNAPGCAFLVMDGASLQFADNSFDTVLCVEAVFHFNSREKFLAEAYRVLKPGGMLLLTDILLTDWGRCHNLWWIEASNQDLNDLPNYRQLYERIGFQNPLIRDVTRNCWEGHYRNLAALCQEKLLNRELESEAYRDVAERIFRIIPFIKYYLLVATRKG